MTNRAANGWVAATMWLTLPCVAVACSSHQQGASINATSPEEQPAASSEALSVTEPVHTYRFDVASEIQDNCISYLLPAKELGFPPAVAQGEPAGGRSLERELHGLATCLQTAPLRHRGLELALIGGDTESSSQLLRQIGSTLSRLGVSADRVNFGGSEPGYVMRPTIVLRLASGSGQPG